MNCRFLKRRSHESCYGSYSGCCRPNTSHYRSHSCHFSCNAYHSVRHVPDEDVCVLHTLVISPECTGKGCKGYGRQFLAFYEQYALEPGCSELRLDPYENNKAARAMYGKHGYTEVGIVPTELNGIPDVKLVLLEKGLGK